MPAHLSLGSSYIGSMTELNPIGAFSVNTCNQARRGILSTSGRDFSFVINLEEEESFLRSIGEELLGRLKSHSVPSSFPHA